MCFFCKWIVALCCAVKLDDVVGCWEHVVLKHGLDEFSIAGPANQGVRVDITHPPEEKRVRFRLVHLATEDENAEKLVDVL